MKPIKFSVEVKKARSLGLPIVALESTIITHGMPYPKNLETAKIVEKTVRDNGATPATIAVIEGSIHIGLESKQLETLSQVYLKTIKVRFGDLSCKKTNRVNNCCSNHDTREPCAN